MNQPDRKPSRLKQLLSRTWLYPLWASARNYATLSGKQGHFRSALRWESVDARGEPIPWYSYPAIEFLEQFDFSGKSVFEYGAGNSTLFWAARAARVVSVESNPDWHRNLSKNAPANCKLVLCPEKDRYLGAIAANDPPFDIIAIDGDHRDEAAAAAPGNLTPNGFVILDNSDWHPAACAALRKADLIQTDFKGFLPIAGYTIATSLFLSRNVTMTPLGDTQPTPPIGSVPSQ
ncbi:SAM-dependent methyltransferase [Verrucomicrobiota bacterium]